MVVCTGCVKVDARRHAAFYISDPCDYMDRDICHKAVIRPDVFLAGESDLYLFISVALRTCCVHLAFFGGLARVP